MNRVALVTGAASVTAAVQRVLDAAGRIDIVVNNAGGHYDDGVQARTLTDDDLLDAFEVNTIGPMRLIRAALPHLLEQRWGRIVNVSSRSGTFSATWADAPAYGVSKAALNMLTLQLAKDLEGTDTPIWLATLPDDGPTGLLFADRRPIDW